MVKNEEMTVNVIVEVAAETETVGVIQIFQHVTVRITVEHDTSMLTCIITLQTDTSIL